MIGNFLTRLNFERKTRELIAPLFRTALTLTGNHADAEDLVQDSYVKAFLAFREGEFGNVETCRAWLYRIMVNTFRDMRRRQLRRAEVELIAEGGDWLTSDPEALVADEPGPYISAEASLMREAIEAAMQQLPTEIRIAIALFFVHGMKYKEIAAVTECPIGTVAFRIARGRTLMQQLLNDGWRDDVKPPTVYLPKCGR